MAGSPAGVDGEAMTVGSHDRIRAFDLARGLAVVFMILVHVLWHWGAPSTWGTPVGLVLSFLGGPPAAPVFMFLMGASLAFSSRASFGSLAGRGVVLVAGGYALNLFRGVLPATLGLQAGVVTADEIAPFTPVWLLTTVDILPLAGLSLVVMAALRAAVRPGWAWLAIAAAVVLAAPWVRGSTDHLPILGALLTPVWGGAPNVYYAVFPWLVYPLVGAVVGQRVAGAADRARTLREVGWIGVVATALGIGLIALTRPALDVRTYWDSPPVLAFAILGFVIAWMRACDLVVRRVGDRGVIRLLERAGRRVTALYVIHWLIVGWGIGFVGFRALELLPVLVAMVAVVVVSWIIGTHLPPRRAAALSGT